MIYNNNDNNDNIYPDGNPSESSPESGEYHYTQSDLPKSDYRDASFTNLPETPMISPGYYYSDSRSQGKNRKRKNNGGFGAKSIIALCLAFSLIGGAGGGVATYFFMGSAQQDSVITDGNMSSLTPTVSPTNTESPAQIVQSPENFPLYSGSEIYALGCPQTVGITTSVTTTNIFRQTTTNAVSGSGFIIRENGYILTNYHVIETAVRGDLDIEVMLYNGESYIAEVVGYEADNDIAVLKIDAEGLPAVTIGNSDTLVVGETLYAIGNPLGELTYTLTNGILSALDRDITIQDETTGDVKTVNMFQISAAVNSGNSGGPVYNSRGEVVGVVTAKYSSNGVEGLGFAIPINDTAYIANELIDNGYVSGKAYFGISVQTVSSANAQYFGMPEGAYVASVTPGSCAEKAGIKIGDVITKLGDKQVLSRSDLANAKKNFKAGETASVELFRAGETIVLSVTFDEELQQPEETQQTEDGLTPQITPYMGDGYDYIPPEERSGGRIFPFFGN